ncbi:DUF134 domain-containing protein [Candidatus Micrarchaeota archaeon]|nr:DUF134 domain-containing protein [Candidatus Micrarchaeota archaeon]MBD3418145.1 DUF134 domain-containing protein [Candidatus Micrarchaeota archaeon]
MPRGRRRRMVWREPGFCRFRPIGIQGHGAVMLTVDEFEAIRLNDLEGRGQKECAEKMDVSQPTFSRIIESARKKVADAIVNGKEIRIEGGEYMVGEKGMPKRDGSGRGMRANRGRGGCNPPENSGARKNRPGAGRRGGRW